MLLAVSTSFGQLRLVGGARPVYLGETVNFFVQVDQARSFDGYQVVLPPDWVLKQTWLVQKGYFAQKVPLSREAGKAGTYLIEDFKLPTGPVQLILQVEMGGLSGMVSWRVMPYSLRVDAQGKQQRTIRDEVRWTTEVEPMAPGKTSENKVLAFRKAGSPLVLRRDLQPDMDSKARYTLECWLRTTGLHEVILSTWNGDEKSAYPLELVVDPVGRLRYYRGRPGHHESMTTQKPVADGAWHHLAVVHDGPSGWSRLFLDGHPADSLYNPQAFSSWIHTPLALGARRANGRQKATIPGFTGMLDELRIWPTARTLTAIRSTMRQPLKNREGLFLGFEDPLNASFGFDIPDHIERVASTLAFYEPVRNLYARAELDAILVSWETHDLHTLRFVIERSLDGLTFETIGTIEQEVIPGRDRPSSFSFRDIGIEEKVVFYRIRQQFEDASEKVSGTIKVGLGKEAEVELMGNFPNPFNPVTTIQYEVLQAGQIRVSVWDISGQMVGVLADQMQKPGIYQVFFDGSDLPSGTYFVRIQTSKEIYSHKMMLAK